MAISPRPQIELEETYNAAADHYDHPAVSFWDRYGRRTVDRLPLISGMAVLDVWEAVRREDVELYRSVKPWSKIFEPVPLSKLLLDCGVSDPEAVAESGWHQLRTPEDWWAIILGSGYRSTVNALSPANRERVRIASIDGVRRAGIQQIRTDVVYGTARRSASP